MKDQLENLKQDNKNAFYQIFQLMFGIQIHVLEYSIF